MPAFDDLRNVATAADPVRSLMPLFWLHGEQPEILLAEIAKMDEGGIGAFVVESRTHPDFLGPTWWRDLEAIVDEASRRRMQVWIMDDEHYPSGFAAGVVARTRPDLLKHYLAERHVDVAGPLPHARFPLAATLREGEELIAVIAGRRVEQQADSGPAAGGAIDGDQLLDLTDHVEQGVLRWAVPEGWWRLFVVVTTRDGGEEWTRDFVDPLSEEAVDLYIDAVHADIYRHIGQHFGHTFQGFFTDEPRFGNASSYTSTPGQAGQVLPYTRGLMPVLDARAGTAFRRWLPALWYDCGPRTTSIRFAYMDVVSERFAGTFMARIGDWCRAHDIRYIGHLVEDNGAHTRLGYGSGHFFRNMVEMDMGGLDVVGYQVRPGFPGGNMASAFGDLDMTFFNWSLAKLASSAAHQTPRMKGLVMCEAFGACGWAEGLRLMKWLTDWLCVRGVNVIVPHAFDPAPFPDDDCPPHFYAGGHNPQWPFFRTWADYANRACALLTGGRHVAEALVLYPAESSWAGAADGCEHAISALAAVHLDCDICSYETFCDPAQMEIGHEGRLACAGETFQAVVLPIVEYVTPAILQRLIACHQAGIAVVCVGGVPRLACRAEDQDTVVELAAELDGLLSHTGAASTYAQLGAYLRARGLSDVTPETKSAGLRHFHYRHGEIDLYFLSNESEREIVDTWVTFRARGVPELWDPMVGTSRVAQGVQEARGTRVQIYLEPYESRFLAFNPGGLAFNPAGLASDPATAAGPRTMEQVPLPAAGWEVSRATAEDYPDFTTEPRLHGLGDWTTNDRLPDFAGTVRYRTTLDIPAAWDGRTLSLDLGEVFELARIRLDGHEIGVRICPPYRCELGEMQPGRHMLDIEVTNTLGARLWDPYSYVVAAEPSGLLGPVSILLPLD